MTNVKARYSQSAVNWLWSLLQMTTFDSKINTKIREKRRRFQKKRAKNKMKKIMILMKISGNPKIK